jgi:small-conductance mechanosensitive channel
MLQNLSSLVNYTYTNTTTTTGTGHSGGVIAALVIVYILIIIYSIFVLWKVFVKAGRPGWAAIIPIYNGWVLFEIAGKPGWWVFGSLLAIIPLVGWIVPLVLYIIAALSLAKRFGKSTAFAIVGLIIFSIVGISILAFGDAKYNGEDKTTGQPTPNIPGAQPPTQPPVAQ